MGTVGLDPTSLGLGLGLELLEDDEVDEGGGRASGMKGEWFMGMEARGEERGRAERTVVGPPPMWIRVSISSMSDWEDGWRGMVSLADWDIFFLCDLILFCFVLFCFEEREGEEDGCEEGGGDRAGEEEKKDRWGWSRVLLYVWLGKINAKKVGYFFLKRTFHTSYWILFFFEKRYTFCILYLNI